MSFQLPEPWKRKLSRASTLVAPVCGEWLGSHCLWMNSPLPFPQRAVIFISPGIILGQRHFIQLRGCALHWRVPGTCFSSYLGSCSSARLISFFMKQAGNHKLLSHANDLAPQLKFRPLSNCSLTYFLWWQILNFLMKK